MRFSALSAFSLAVVLALPFPCDAQRSKKRDREEITQILEVPKDPPQAFSADTRRLVFFTSPLSGKGLLSQQVRDALKSVSRQAGSAQIVRLRAFTAGTGDLRRVQAIVSETFTEKRQPIPALTVVQTGALPLEGAQVLLEATAVTKKVVHPNGVAWISGVGATVRAPGQPAGPLLDQAALSLSGALRTFGSAPEDMLRVSCFVSSLDNHTGMRSRLASAFPKASIAIVQTQRAPSASLAECEGTAHLAKAPSKPLEFIGAAEANGSPRIALVGSDRVLFTTAKIAFRYEDEDLRLAFDRMKRTLVAEKTSMSNVAFCALYPLTGGIAERIKKIRLEFFDASQPPATTVVAFEALPSLDASFALDVVAVP